MSADSDYSDLGVSWLHYQVARLRQRHQQCGQHFRMELFVLLERAARIAREVRIAETPATRPDSLVTCRECHLEPQARTSAGRNAEIARWRSE
jgi:hypothetical protein